MKKPVLVFIIISLFTSSCYYVENERYSVEITSDYKPSISLSSNLDTLDSISVTDSLLFKYSVEIDTGSLYFSDVYIGNMQLFRSDSTTDSLHIYPYYVSVSGDYELTLVSYFKTYTGSLADLMDAEFLAADTSWIIHINRDVK